MTLCPEAQDVLNYLKSFTGRYVALMEISRQAGGRQRFKENPNWAKALVAPLVEADLLEMNERGHYRLKNKDAGQKAAAPARSPAPRPAKKIQGKVVGDDYFPTLKESGIVGDNYFPGSGG
jgi:hypothetical protein